MNDDHFEVHQSCYALHPTESWVRGVVSEVVEVSSRGGIKEKRYNVTVDLNPKQLPTINNATNKIEKLPVQALHHVVTSSGGAAEAPSDGAAATTTADDDEQFDDLLHMSYLHDSTLLAQVRKRYFQNFIYTHIGPIVLALNPYDFTLPNYVDSNMPRYIAEGDKVIRSGSTNLPHAWSTAHLAYFSMLNDFENQSVIVSGESGAGKTETAKIVVKYLGFVSTDAANDEERAEAASVTKRVNLTSPILEAFGNAKTRFNDNSSRFGKFMKVHFSGGGRGVMMGASMEVYLLEKSRIISHGPEERGYHTFYQLLASGAAGSTESHDNKKALKDRLKVTDATSYPSLNVGKAVKIAGVDDGKDFDEVVAAMDAVGLAEAEQRSVWTTIAGVLHALKMTFESPTADESALSEASRNHELAILKDLWQVDTDKLVKELTTTTTTVRSDTFTKNLRKSEAIDYRDSVCKALYEALFLWLVARINDLIAPSADNAGGTDAQWIALLDIFGFENFAHGNRFEQLCINLANETLQNHYNSIIFTRDMEECRAENINTESVSFYDNQPCLDLVCGHNFALCGPGSTGKATSRISILSLLDEESSLANATDLTFCEKLASTFMGSGTASPRKTPSASPTSPTPMLTKQGGAAPNTFDHDGHPNFMKPKTSRNTFVIRHYAGDVTYTVDGFKTSNLDSTKEELKDVFRNSSDPFIAGLLAPAVEATNTPRKGGRGKSTVAGFFKSQLIALMSEINGTHPHWIRCVKPHSAKKPRMFHGNEVMAQLRSAGVLETVRIRQQSFAVRLPFVEFVKEYILLSRCRLDENAGAGKKIITAAKGGDSFSDPKATSRSILDTAGFTSPDADSLAQIGNTKVFLRTEAFYTLSSKRHKIKSACAGAVAAYIRGRQSAWRVACLLKNRQVQVVQAFLHFRPSHHVFREKELRAREAYLLVSFRSLLVLQSDEHAQRERDVLAVEQQEYDSLIAKHHEGLEDLKEAWLVAKAQKDTAQRADVEQQEKETRRQIIEEDAKDVQQAFEVHQLLVAEYQERQEHVIEPEMVEAKQFAGAHEQIRVEVARLIKQQMLQKLKDTEVAEFETRRQGIEPEANDSFAQIVFSHRLQFTELMLRDELSVDADRQLENLKLHEEEAWALLHQRWLQVKQAQDAEDRLALRRLEKHHREQLGLDWLQTLMVLLESLEGSRQDAEVRTMERLDREAFEEEERVRIAREKEHQRQLREQEVHRAKAQYLWKLAQREERHKERERRLHEEALAAKMVSHAAAAEYFTQCRREEAADRKAVAAASKRTGHPSPVGKPGRFSGMHFATAPSAGRTVTSASRARSISPGGSIYTKEASAILSAGRSRSRSPGGATRTNFTTIDASQGGSHNLVNRLDHIKSDAYAYHAKAALPVTVTNDATSRSRFSQPRRSPSGGGTPRHNEVSLSAQRPLSSPRQSGLVMVPPLELPAQHHHQYGRSSPSLPSPSYAAVSHLDHSSKRSKKVSLSHSIDPYDPNWAPPDPTHAYLPDGAVVCTEFVEIPTDIHQHTSLSSKPRQRSPDPYTSPLLHSTAAPIQDVSPLPKNPNGTLPPSYNNGHGSGDAPKPPSGSPPSGAMAPSHVPASQDPLL